MRLNRQTQSGERGEFSAPLRRALLPFVPIYRLGLALRERRLASGREPIRRLHFPVISIGNLSTGGAGKTPLAIVMAQTFKARGFDVDVLSRGYGRNSTAPARVDPDGTADEFGDEPLLIARQAEVPVYVAPQRYDAGMLAETHPAVDARAVHILDDAFQHRQLHRDIDILLLSRLDLHDRLLPAGNLREPLSAMKRASVLAIPAADPTLESDLRVRGWQGPIWRLHRRMEVPQIDGPALAFCGIARPHQFFAGLEFAGVRLAASRAFRDHHRYTARDLENLVAQARSAGAATLLTTEKDLVRLRGLPAPLPILTASLRIEIEDEAAAMQWLEAKLAAKN